MALEQEIMLVAAYKAKFNALYRYVALRLGTEKERIWLFIKGLNNDLQVLSFHITFSWKGSNKVLIIDFL